MQPPPSMTPAVRDALASLVVQFKCPTCKAYTLYVEGGEVRCRKCGYHLDLPAFALKFMGYDDRGGRPVVAVPDLFGGPAKVVTL